MSLMLILAAAGMPSVSHVVPVVHEGVPLRVVYQGELAIRTKDTGAAPPSRPFARRCRWSAHLVVDRHVEGREGGQAALAVKLGSEKLAEGSRPGYCRTSRPAIEQQVASHHEAAAAERLRRLAEADRPVVLAELENIRTVVQN